MKLALAIVLNAGLLALALPWLWRHWTGASVGWRGALALGLGGRLLLAVVRPPSADAQSMGAIGHTLNAQLWAEPAAALRAVLGDELHYGGHHFVYYGMSNTLFFGKLLGFLNLASLRADWLNAAYLSLFSFVGCWLAARAVARCFPATPAGAGVLAFVLWPSVLFWTAGIAKDTVFVGSGAALLAVFLRLVYDARPLATASRAGLVAMGLLLAVLHFKMRYFFAAPLLGLLAGLGLLRGVQRLGLARRRWAQVLVLAAVLAAGAWIAAEARLLHLNRFTNQLMLAYGKIGRNSVGRPHLEYPDLRPELSSILAHAPLAAANTLARPWLGESKQLQYMVAGLENALLLVLLLTAAWAAVRGRAGRLPFALTLGLLLYCLLLAALMGLSVPNLGSLSRYRTGLLPYLLLLLLQNDFAARWLSRLGLNEPFRPTRPQPAAPAKA